MIIKRDFFERDTALVAQELIGQTLVRSTPEGETRGIIVETEAYLGTHDPAAHSYKGRSERVRVLYGPKGHAYIYLIYGMYWCLNFAAGFPDEPDCVLIRALEPVGGTELMKKRRNTDNIRNLCAGPGKLCMAMGITGNDYGSDLCEKAGGLFLEYTKPSGNVEVSKRIHIDYAGEAADWPLRFTLRGSGYIS